MGEKEYYRSPFKSPGTNTESPDNQDQSFHQEQIRIPPGYSEPGKTPAYRSGDSSLAECRDGYNGNLFVQTRLLYNGDKGQETIETDRLVLHPDTGKMKSNIQGIGSAITYGRRYQLMTLLGIAGEGEDDDGTNTTTPPPPSPPHGDTMKRRREKNSQKQPRKPNQ